MMPVTTVMMTIFIPIMPPIIAITMIAIVAVGRVMVGVGANHGTRSPPDPGANHLAIAPHLVADGRATQATQSATQATQSATYGRFILLATMGRCRATQRPADGGTGQGARIAAHLLT